MTKEGLDDILFRLGYTYLDKKRGHGSLYGNVIVPLSKGSKSEYIFEPLVGSCHWGIGGGHTFSWKLHWKRKHMVSIAGDMKYTYRLKSKEIRSFDLKNNGPWSRYLLFSRQGGIRPLDGINILTQEVDITPGGNFELSLLLHYGHENLHFEWGYNLWARTKESIELHNKWNQEEERLGIYHEGGISKTASTATIKQGVSQTSADSTFRRIKESDFNLETATHSSALSNTIFFGTSCESKILEYPVRIGCAASYEFGFGNTALNQFSLWVNAHVHY